jgi:hypothetical protein
MDTMITTDAIAQARHAIDPQSGERRSGDRIRRYREARLQINPRPVAGRGDRFAHLKRMYD